MMASMAQPYSPHPAGLQQHPGLAQGHPMAGGHPQQGGQPVPGMPQMHMGVSGPGGPQVSQAGALLGVMPPGAGGPGGPSGPSAHALQHLNLNQPQMYQQQQAQQAQMAFANPQMHMAQQHLIQQQQQRQAAAARQAMLAQQYNGGMPMNMPNGMTPQMNQAQFAAMRGAPNMRPVALPQHLQQQQQQAQLGLEQQQAQQHAQQQHQQQQQLLAQQMAMQQATAAQTGTNQGQPNQIPQQLQNLQNAHLAAHQQQQQQQQQQVASQQSQGQGQAQPQTQQPQQPQTQAQLLQAQAIPQQQQAAGPPMIQARDQMKGQCVLKLVQFGDHLSQFNVSSKPIDMYMIDGAQFLDAQAKKQQDDLNYWSDFVETFFSQRGVLRHSVWIVDEQSAKQYEITYPALARYFHTHFESGIHNMQLITEKAKEKALPNNCHFLESPKSSFIYWFENGSQLVANGTLRAQFDANQKIELLEFVTSKHEEYVPRTKIVEAARPLHEWQKEWLKVNAPPDGKQSPEMSKKGKARPMKSPPTQPPDIDLPDSKVKLNMGITPSVFRFLELAEVMGQMNPLFNYSHINVSLTPYDALNSYVSNISANNAGAAGGNPNGINQSGQRTPSMAQFPMGQSPATAHLNLPDNNSMIAGSPAQGHMQAPSMALQQSQQGTSSSGPSANTSPNVSNKRRRASVKAEDDSAGQPNGVQNKVKPSPRMGKRQKGTNQS